LKPKVVIPHLEIGFCGRSAIFLCWKKFVARSEEERLRIRQEKETPIIDRLILAIKAKLVV
jgi:hypothetical protein